MIAGNDEEGVTVSGSSGGSFSTPFLDIYGQVDVTGGKLSGDKILIDSQIDPSITFANVGPLPSTSTQVDVSGKNASIESSDSVLIGGASDLPAALRNGVRHREHLIRVLIKQKMIIAEMAARHMPVEAFCLQVEAKNVGQKPAQRF